MKNSFIVLCCILCVIIGLFGGYTLSGFSPFDTVDTPPSTTLLVAFSGANTNIVDNGNMIDSNDLLDTLLVQKIHKQEKTYSEATPEEVKIALENIKYTLDRGVIDDQHLTYYGVGNSVLFQFIESDKDCEVLLGKMNTPSVERFIDECLFQYYLKTSLESKGKVDIPEEILSEYSLLRNVDSKLCTIEDDFPCILLFGDSISRQEFNKLAKNAISKRGMSEQSFIDSISIPSFGSYVFYESIKKIDTLQEAVDLYYDAALLNKAVYESDVDYCDEIDYKWNKVFCEDMFDDSQKTKYQKIFSDFYGIVE